MKHSVAYFTGMDERGGELAGDASAALLALNTSTDHGVLASAHGCTAVTAPLPPENGIPTRLYLFSDRVGGQTTEHIIAGTASGVYAYNAASGTWQALFTGAQGGDWGFLTYQHNEETLLLFGNGADAVRLWDGASAQSTVLEGAPAKGRFFALHYERVWMCGDPTQPDRVYYSRAMDLTNWTADVELPDRGGGFVELPTFDGGEVTNLYKVGSDLCVLKSTTALLLYGASPASYQVMEMTGGVGTQAGRTAAVAGLSGYFLTPQGIGVQSGTALSLWDDRKLPRLFEPAYTADGSEPPGHLHADYAQCACGAACGERLFFALPAGDCGTPPSNNYLLDCDLTRQTYTLHTGLSVVSMAKAGATRGKLYLLLRDGRVVCWGADAAQGNAPAVWVTPWLDFGTNRRKTLTGFALYGKMTSVEGVRGACVRVTAECENGHKSRLLTPRRGGDELHAYHFRLPGRRFRFRIEALRQTMFCFSGGLEVEVN